MASALATSWVREDIHTRPKTVTAAATARTPAGAARLVARPGATEPATASREPLTRTYRPPHWAYAPPRYWKAQTTGSAPRAMTVRRVALVLVRARVSPTPMPATGLAAVMPGTNPR